MRRIRQRLTFANVVSLIALFVALGGTAIAAVIVNSNSQVARGTISGHDAPSGKHPNIISGSINGQDLQNPVFHKPNLQNGWTAADAGEPVFTKDSSGIVHLFGSVYRPAGSSASTIFRLPAVYRPSHYVDITVAVVGAVPAVLGIESDGTVLSIRPDHLCRFGRCLVPIGGLILQQEVSVNVR